MEQEEFQETSQRAGGKDVVQLARVVARVIATMGLGPTGAMGQPICLVDPSTPSSSERWWFKVGVMILVIILVAFAIGCFVVRRYVKQQLHDLYHLRLQVAEADTTIGEHMVTVPQLRHEDGAEFTLRIVMAHLFRNASFRVTTFISICP